MKLFLILFFITLTTNVLAQVGVNTDSPESTLDVRAVNHKGAVTATDGILVPRVNDLTTDGTVNGQLVYLTENATNRSLGFYFWNGATWASIATSSKSVTNELCFEDNNYYYVSLLINGTTWEAYQYDKTDVNTEGSAVGVGAQPSTLAELQVLTYN
jgi:hypothetical protein